MKERKEKSTKGINHPYKTQNESKVQSEEQKTECPALSFDNWEVIAGNLRISDLVALADVCSDARQAARLIFTRKYAAQKLELTMNGYCMEIWVKWTLVDNNIDDSRSFLKQNAACLKFLRVFGDLIPAWNIWIHRSINNNDNRLQKLIGYVNEFSSTSRKNLKIYQYLPALIEVPLKNIETINLYTHRYSAAEFNALVKNVSNLTITCDANMYLQQNMPHVKVLRIVGNGIGDIEVLHVMQLNPQIRELFVNDDLKMKLNGTEIDLEIFNFSKAVLLKMVRPEQIDKMYLNDWNYWSHMHSVDFIKEFINLRCLSMWHYRKILNEVIHGVPKLEIIQLVTSLVPELEDMKRIILSAESKNKLSTLSFHFDRMEKCEEFQAKFNRLITTRPWSITLNEDGPNKYKYSLVLNKIRSE